MTAARRGGRPAGLGFVSAGAGGLVWRAWRRAVYARTFLSSSSWSPCAGVGGP